MIIAASPDPTATNNKLFAFSREITKNFFRLTITHDSAWWHFDSQICPAQTAAKCYATRIAASGMEQFAVREVAQGVQVGVDDENNVAAFATITAVGTAFRDILLMSEADLAGSPVARPDHDLTKINKA
jgi:hypothetical protein